MTVPPGPRQKRMLATRLKRVSANETNPIYSSCDSVDPDRMSDRWRQGDHCPAAEHEDRDQGRGDSWGARESHGELPALSGREPRIGVDSRCDAPPGGPEDREGIRVPDRRGSPALTQSLWERDRERDWTRPGGCAFCAGTRPEPQGLCPTFGRGPAIGPDRIPDGFRK